MALHRDTLLGLVFFGSMGLLGWATVSLTSLSFDPKPSKVVRFASASGLRKGDSVYVLGKRLGQVREVAWTPSTDQWPIRVELEFDRNVELHADASIVIRDSSLLGGHQVDITPGTTGAAPAKLMTDS